MRKKLLRVNKMNSKKFNLLKHKVRIYRLILICLNKVGILFYKVIVLNKVKEKLIKKKLIIKNLRKIIL